MKIFDNKTRIIVAFFSTIALAIYILLISMFFTKYGSAIVSKSSSNSHPLNSLYTLLFIFAFPLMAVSPFICKLQEPMNLRRKFYGQVKEYFDLDVTDGFLLEHEIRNMREGYNHQWSRLCYQFDNADILNQESPKGLKWNTIPYGLWIARFLEEYDPEGLAVPRNIAGYYRVMNKSINVQDISSEAYPEERGIDMHLAVFDTSENKLYVLGYNSMPDLVLEEEKEEIPKPMTTL